MPTETAPAKAAKIRVGADDLRAMVAGIFAARGVPEADAADVADALVWANLRGVDSHGVSRVPRYIDLFDKGESVPDAAVTVQRPRAAVAIVDAHAAPGPIAMLLAVTEAVSGARECGIGWASVRGTVHTGAIGYYTSRAAGAGMAASARSPDTDHGLRGCAGRGRRHQPAVRRGARGLHEVVLLDMATAVMALGRIAQLKAAGAALPPGVAVTADGEQTTDPALAAVPVPVGGAKGSGLSLVFEMLASGLVANPTVPAFHSAPSRAAAPPERIHPGHRHLILPFQSHFSRHIDDTVDAIKALPPGEGVSEVLVPGERGRRSELDRRQAGIPLGPKVWRGLTELAKPLGVAVPAPLAG